MEDSFCFDEIVERKGSGCIKWDAKMPVEVEGDVIPLWVADMDFPAAPCIRKAMQERMDHAKIVLSDSIIGFNLADYLIEAPAEPAEDSVG